MDPLLWILIAIAVIIGASLTFGSRRKKRSTDYRPPHKHKPLKQSPTPIAARRTGGERRDESLEGVRAAIDRQDTFEKSAAEWLADAIRDGEADGLGYDQIARNIRSRGAPLSADEKRALGMRANAKVGSGFVEALTAKGREAPMDAPFLLVQYVMHQESLKRHRESGEGDFQMELVAVKDDRTCDAARKRDGEIFNVDDVPELPLPDCDAEYCRCIFVVVAPDDF